MNRLLFFVVAATVRFFASPITFSNEWKDDILGNGYQMQYIKLKSDYAGEERCCVVKKNCTTQTQRAILYVHGFNDYFFQSEMGNFFACNGYNFYAVDLRRYGRALMAGQRPFDVRDIGEYFSDIDAALQVIQAEGNTEIILMGHSTGGLTTSYYLARGKGKRFNIKALVLNSPFLEMNMSAFLKDVAFPTLAWFSKFCPTINIPQGGGKGFYAKSLLKKYHGEWTFNTEWKREQSADVSLGWVGAIYRAQAYLHTHPKSIKVPILLMHSSKSVYDEEWSDNYMCGDAVLNVADIRQYGLQLGTNVTEYTVINGLHDLFLSKREVRIPLYSKVLSWINKQK